MHAHLSEIEQLARQQIAERTTRAQRRTTFPEKRRRRSDRRAVELLEGP